MTPIHFDTVELLLKSMSCQAGDGLQTSFMFGKPGPFEQKNFGTEIYFNDTALLRAALFVRNNGPAHLKYLPMSDLKSKLNNFITDNFWHIFSEVMFERFNGSFASRLPLTTKRTLSDLIAASQLFQPAVELTVFPLDTIKVTADFDSSAFLLISPTSLKGSIIGEQVDDRQITPDIFPPLANWKGRIHRPTAWLGVRSPAYLASRKMKAAVMGAIALTQQPSIRHMFSGRIVLGGRCTFGESTTYSFEDQHTPPLMNDIIISESDTTWLNILAAKLGSNAADDRRQISALEYFNRAWPLGPSERFPLLCMALDAVLGSVSHATQAMISGIKEYVGAHIEDDRIRHLVKLRAAVIHGAAPDVYDASRYTTYFDRYEADPIRDMELIVDACLRAKTFSGAMIEHPHPHAAKIAELQASGRLPANRPYKTILDHDGSSDSH